MSSLPRARRSSFLQWSAAAVTAAALYGLPLAVFANVVGDGRVWLAVLAVCAVVLVIAAVRRWSPLVVLATVVLSGVAMIAAFFITASAGTCGSSSTAAVVEWVGAVVLGLAVGTWGVRGGPRALWAVPAGWAVAVLWYVVIAHLVPHGAGGCFE